MERGKIHFPIIGMAGNPRVGFSAAFVKVEELLFSSILCYNAY